MPVTRDPRRRSSAADSCGGLWVLLSIALGGCASRASHHAAHGQDVSDGSTAAFDAASDAASGPGASDDGGSPDAARARLPAYAPYPAVVFPDDNPYTPAKALLGKMLFWDEQLSADDSVACGTCHQPAAGGSDPRTSRPDFVGHPGEDGVRGTSDDPRGSLGIAHCARAEDGSFAPIDDPVFGHEAQVTRRRAMSFLDAMFAPELFWDGRAKDAFVDPEHPDQVLLSAHGALESQAAGPLQNTAEMTCDGFLWSDLTTKLASVEPLARATALPSDLAAALSESRGYPLLFEAAFGTQEITPRAIAFAIATYERTLTSDETPWDRYNAGERGALTASQERGMIAFLTAARCACCHGPPLFGGAGFGNDGFSTSTWDPGRFEVTGNEVDKATFRVPSLRNVGLREAGGLLHDGAGAGRDLATLLDHYNQAPLFPAHVSFCVRLAAGLSAEQLGDVAEFLRGGLTDPRVAAEQPPFDRPRLSSEAPAPR